jgi:general secretion pathway protein C
MKLSFKNLGERIRSFLSSVSSRFAKRSKGIAALPGESATVSGGKLKIPLINWESIYRKSFLYNSIGAAICGYFIADLLVAGLTPLFPPTEAPRPRSVQSNAKDYMAYEMTLIPGRGRPHLFSKSGLVPDNDDGGGGMIGGAPVKTNLPLTLLGVIVIANSDKSVASVEDKGKNQVIAVRKGDEIANRAFVETIEGYRIIFRNEETMRLEYIELPQDQILATRRSAPVKASGNGIQKTSENRYTLDRKAIETALGNDFSKILTQARCVPEFEGGKSVGYRCFQIEPGSVYQQLGLEENDIICGIDGESLNNPAAAFQKLQALKDTNTRSMSVCIKRNGVVMNSQFDIN